MTARRFPLNSRRSSAQAITATLSHRSTQTCDTVVSPQHFVVRYTQSPRFTHAPEGEGSNGGFVVSGIIDVRPAPSLYSFPVVLSGPLFCVRYNGITMAVTFVGKFSINESPTSGWVIVWPTD